MTINMEFLALYALERVGFNEMSYQFGQENTAPRCASECRRHRLRHLAHGLVVHDRLLTGRASISIKAGEIVQEKSTIHFTPQRR